MPGGLVVSGVTTTSLPPCLPMVTWKFRWSFPALLAWKGLSDVDRLGTVAGVPTFITGLQLEGWIVFSASKSALLSASSLEYVGSAAIHVDTASVGWLVSRSAALSAAWTRFLTGVEGSSWLVKSVTSTTLSDLIARSIVLCEILQSKVTKNLTCSESGILFLRKIPGSGICANSSSLGYALKRWHVLSFSATLNIGVAKSNFGM